MSGVGGDVRSPGSAGGVEKPGWRTTASCSGRGGRGPRSSGVKAPETGNGFRAREAGVRGGGRCVKNLPPLPATPGFAPERTKGSGRSSGGRGRHPDADERAYEARRREIFAAHRGAARNGRVPRGAETDLSAPSVLQLRPERPESDRLSCQLIEGLVPTVRIELTTC